ncbi:Inactive ubiquitin carboxyl-terminal hydrolase MINDY-4B, partial [Nibea albiflora]
MDRQVFGPLHHDGPVSVWTGSSRWTGECLDRFIMMDRRVFGPVHHDGPRLLDVGKDEDLEEAPPPCRTLPQLCSIPRRLVISPGLGGMPVTPKLTEGGARAVQMVVQARIIKYLLFIRQSGSGGRVLHSLCEVGQRDQEKALVAALSDSLWLAGQEFKEEGSHGVILFLYSLILSRTVDRLKDDLDSTTSHLLYLSLGNFVCRQALLNLLLTGRASPNVFNGTVHVGEDGHPLERPLQGVLSRSDVGYLHWSREEMEQGRLPQVGSMLKTPRFPVWLCCINNSYSVAFSVNRSLLSDWKMEHQFQLNYYNGQNSQNTTARLTVDTHSHHWEALSSDSDGDLEKRFPSLEMTIRTKWEGAAI